MAPEEWLIYWWPRAESPSTDFASRFALSEIGWPPINHLFDFGSAGLAEIQRRNRPLQILPRASHSAKLVAKGGIEPPTQEFSVLLVGNVGTSRHFLIV